MTSSCTIDIAEGTGDTLTYRFRAPPLVYKTIVAKIADTPLRLTVTAHGLPDEWDVALLDVGYDYLSAKASPPARTDYLRATAIDANTIEFNEVDLARLDGDWVDGSIAYLTPVDLAGASAELTIYNGSEVVDTLDGTLDYVAKTISFDIPDTYDIGQYTFAAVFIDSLSVPHTLDEGELEIYTPGSPPCR